MTVKEAGADLVAGAPVSDKDQQLTIKVLRGFMRDGKPVEIGSELTLPARRARELVGMNKAELVTAPQEPEDEGAENAEDDEPPKRRGWRAKAKE